MAPLASPTQNSIASIVQQSEPVDLSAPYDPAALRGKTILLTGGATGLGAAFARRWAAHGAHLIIGDVNDEAGEALVAELRGGAHPPPSGEQHHHFVHADVTSWPDQVALFRRAATELSPGGGGIDAVVACAGVSDRDGAATGRGLENPAGLDGPDPPRPELRCVQVNLVGAMYTAHLALFWLQKNKNDDDDHRHHNNNPSPSSSETRETPRRGARDRHLLLIGSSAGLAFLPGVPEYVTSKHGVTGLFRSLRALSYRQGVRVNMLCPYFVDTPILPNRAVALMAGNGIGRLDDAVDAATRLVAGDGLDVGGGGGGRKNQRIAGRALLVGPRASLLTRVLPDRELAGAGGGAEEDEVEPNDAAGGGDVVVDGDVAAGRGQGIWEVYAHDFETVDFFIRRYIRLLNTISAIKGWIGFWRDLFHALFVRKEPKQARHRV